jgi:hypothetical protein
MRTKKSVVQFCFLFVACVTACYHNRFGERGHVLTPQGESEIPIMNFSQPLSIDPLTPGWYHYTFFWHPPMTIEFVTHDSIPAIKLSTRDSASMLIRHVAITLTEYPWLSWQWYVEQSIASPLDENTKQGDDHPARLFLVFQTDTGDNRAMEIIWGNTLTSGQYKYIDGFAHYVARGGKQQAKQWFTENLNLLEIYQTIWSDHKPVTLMEIGLFCDSDDTNTASVSYFANVRMRKVH